nr:SAM-dependent methyltransferase [uncultured Actinoplanes sp.]
MDAEVDPQRPSAARIYDYYLGGTHNFAADRQTAAVALEAMPELPAIMRANRDFLRRAVTVAAGDGVDQFLDLGCGIPAGPGVHDIARRSRPGARVVYADLDPVAVLHHRRLLGGDPGADALLADLTDADAVLAAEPVCRLLDPARPVCLLVLAVAQLIPDSERLGRALETYRRAAAPGSYLVLSHAGDGGDADRAARVRRVYNTTTSPMVLRDREEILALLGDWSLVEPGLSTVGRWRPDPGAAPLPPVVDRSFVVAVTQKSD